MRQTVKLTSKRQATFPASVCEQLGLQPGDEIQLRPKVENGEQFWVIQKSDKPQRPWLGALRAYAENVDTHSMETIRESIAKGRQIDS